MIWLVVLLALFIISVSIWEIRNQTVPTYNDIRYTALREEELHKIIEHEVAENPKAVAEAKKELKRRGIKH